MPSRLHRYYLRHRRHWDRLVPIVLQHIKIGQRINVCEWAANNRLPGYAPSTSYDIWNSTIQHMKCDYGIFEKSGKHLERIL